MKKLMAGLDSTEGAASADEAADALEKLAVEGKKEEAAPAEEAAAASEEGK